MKPMKSILVALAVFLLIQAVCVFTRAEPEEAKTDAVFVMATVETGAPEAEPIPSESGEAPATEQFYAELG